MNTTHIAKELAEAVRAVDPSSDVKAEADPIFHNRVVVTVSTVSALRLVDFLNEARTWESKIDRISEVAQVTQTPDPNQGQLFDPEDYR